MSDPFFLFARKIRPGLDNLIGQQRIAATADVITLIYSLPLAFLGWFWLVRSTDLTIIREEILPLTVMAIFVILFNRLSFFLISEIRAGGYANSSGTLDNIVIWTALLLFGPSGLWLDVLWNLAQYVYNLVHARHAGDRWGISRIFVSSQAGIVISALIALEVYRDLGGVIPIESLSLQTIAPAMAAIFVQFFILFTIAFGYAAYAAWALRSSMNVRPWPVVIFFLLSLGLPALANPFAILAAGMYVQDGFSVYILDMIGLLLVALLARQLSMAVEKSRQQARELRELEKLGRAILNAPPDASTLSELLKEFVPAMFAASFISIWISPNRLLLQDPEGMPEKHSRIWGWLQSQKDARVFQSRDQLPWEKGTTPHPPVVVTPILDFDTRDPIGSIYLELRAFGLPWDTQSLMGLLPGVQTLGAQVASAIHQAKVYANTLAMQKTLQELSLARQIQASFLPERVPELPGWELTASLEPARQIAGDFYDFILLPGNRIGILIADVADKGLGPALYMALSRTLIRTYAFDFRDNPAAVITTANRRILEDARANLFVTVFYGVLEPERGVLSYCNAGHTPPYLIHHPGERSFQTLRNTGMPLGIDEQAVWREEQIAIRPGEKLLLYTDGVTDAQNIRGEFIDRKAILEYAFAAQEWTASGIRSSILAGIHQFVGDAPQFDDITLVIIDRR